MQGKTLLIKQKVGWFDTDVKVHTSKGKKTKWCKAWAKRAQKKIRKRNKNISNEE